MLSPTDVHIRGYSGIAEPCLGRASINLKIGRRYHKDDIFFNNKETSNFLSRDACKAFGIIPKGFPHEQLNSLNVRQTPTKTRNNEKYSQGLKAVGQNPAKMRNNEEYIQKPKGGVECFKNFENNSRIIQMVDDYKEVFGSAALTPMAVSYTHLTLPTNREV